MTKEYYTPAEFSQAINNVFSKETIIRMCHNGDIKSIRRPVKFAHFKIPKNELSEMKKKLKIEE